MTKETIVLLIILVASSIIGTFAQIKDKSCDEVDPSHRNLEISTYVALRLLLIVMFFLSLGATSPHDPEAPSPDDMRKAFTVLSVLSCVLNLWTLFWFRHQNSKKAVPTDSSSKSSSNKTV